MGSGRLHRNKTYGRNGVRTVTIFRYINKG
jgi:hypothetical protein